MLEYFMVGIMVKTLEGKNFVVKIEEENWISPLLQGLFRDMSVGIEECVGNKIEG